MEIWQRKIMAELGVGREDDALLAENLVTDEGTLRGVAEKKDVLAESEFRSGFMPSWADPMRANRHFKLSQ